MPQRNATCSTCHAAPAETGGRCAACSDFARRTVDGGAFEECHECGDLLTMVGRVPGMPLCTYCATGPDEDEGAIERYLTRREIEQHEDAQDADYALDLGF